MGHPYAPRTRSQELTLTQRGWPSKLPRLNPGSEELPAVFQGSKRAIGRGVGGEQGDVAYCREHTKETSPDEEQSISRPAIT